MTGQIARPDHPALDAVEQALDDLERAEHTVIELKQAVVERTVALAAVKDRNERLRIVRYLYWFERRVNGNALTTALLADWPGGTQEPTARNVAAFSRWQHKMRIMVGPIGYRECKTPDCDASVPITSRTAHDTGRGRDYCDDCERCPRKPVPCRDWPKALSIEDAQRHEQRRAYEQRVARDQAELAHLKENAQLEEAQLVRLYELMSRYDERY